MGLSFYRENWKKNRLSKEDKRQHWEQMREVLSLIKARELKQAKILGYQIHGEVQLSCFLHPASHLLLAKIEKENQQYPLFFEQCWLTV